jgi:hypothetical protein
MDFISDAMLDHYKERLSGVPSPIREAKIQGSLFMKIITTRARKALVRIGAVRTDARTWRESRFVYLLFSKVDMELLLRMKNCGNHSMNELLRLFRWVKDGMPNYDTWAASNSNYLSEDEMELVAKANPIFFESQ